MLSKIFKFTGWLIAILVSIYLLAIRDVLGISHNRNENMANTYYEQRDYDKSKDFYIQALSTKRDCKHCLKNLALCNSKLAINDEDDKPKQRKSINEMIVSNTAIGSINLGMMPENILTIANIHNYKVSTFERCQDCDSAVDISIATSNDDNYIVASFGFLEKNKIHDLAVLSKTHKTRNGIRVGLSIDEYLELYPEAILYETWRAPVVPHEKEYFAPPEYQTDSTFFRVMLTSEKSNEPIYDWIEHRKKYGNKISFDQSARTKKYNTAAYISTILIGYTDKYYEAIYKQMQ